MILPRYHIGPSGIAGAGKGLFLDEDVERGRILVAPDAINETSSFAEILSRPDAAQTLPATVRWFEDRYTVSTDWPDECYVNHAFEPTGLWHLGFIFAASALPAGTEVTVDYRHLLAPGQEEDFRDAATDAPIVGFTWKESLGASSQALLALLD
ncbi:SET domain-containing protein [Dokdonella sp. MW10]|uniref:SET domain-containing protein n=1 Tax=Dokdonella sp. MW10 TaxID=2992926 RepID=UPI003F7EC770